MAEERARHRPRDARRGRAQPQRDGRAGGGRRGDARRATPSGRAGRSRRFRRPGARRSPSCGACSACCARWATRARSSPRSPGSRASTRWSRSVREAGLPVAVRVEGDPRPLPPGIDLSAYRIVQEALTNALKHAGPARAEVVVQLRRARGPAPGQRRRARTRPERERRRPRPAGDARAGGALRRRARRGPAAPRAASPSPRAFPSETAAPVSIRVLIADDQALVRDGFGMILDAQGDIEVVGQAADGREAIERCRELRPDVVLMDIRMPRLDGIEATRRLVADGEAGPRVLMLTTFDRERLRVRGDEGRRQRVPAEGRPPRGAGRRRARGGCRRRAAGPRPHPPPDRGLRAPPAARRHGGRARSPSSPTASAR